MDFLTKSFSNGMRASLEAFNLLGFKNDARFHSPAYSYSEHREMYQAQVLVKFNYVFGKRRVSGADDRYDSSLEKRFSN